MAPNLNLFERKSTPDSLAPSNLEPVQSFSLRQHPARESKQSHLGIHPRTPKAHLYRPARQETLPPPSSSKLKRPYPTGFRLCNLQTRVAAWSLGDELVIRLKSHDVVVFCLPLCSSIAVTGQFVGCYMILPARGVRGAPSYPARPPGFLGLRKCIRCHWDAAMGMVYSVSQVD
jgi:hypothetical protein